MGFRRLRLRGFSGANDEFLLAATAQNLKRLAKHAWKPPQHLPVAANKRPLLIEADAQNTLSDEFINDIGRSNTNQVQQTHR